MTLRERLFRFQHRHAPYIFVAPFILTFLVFMLYPLLKSLILSFHITSGPSSQVFVGLENFGYMLTDLEFWRALRNTTVFAVCSVCIQLPLSLGLALLLNSRLLRMRNTFRFVFFSPYLLGPVFVAVLFSVIFAPRFGLFTRLMNAVTAPTGETEALATVAWILVMVVLAPVWIATTALVGLGARDHLREGRTRAGAAWAAGAAASGVSLPLLFAPWVGLIPRLFSGVKGLNVPLDTDWLGSAPLVMPALVLTALWLYVGFNMIYFLAALQAVDRDLYDAAAVDGANAWQRFRHVTFPGIKPVVVFVVVLSTIGSFKLFELPYLMLQGSGPEQSGLTLVMYLYQKGFESGDLGYASTVGWTLVAIVLVVSLAQMRFTGAWRRD